jgi:hypothetical protein
LSIRSRSRLRPGDEECYPKRRPTWSAWSSVR